MLSWITMDQSSELIAQWRASDAQDAPSHPQCHISCVSGSPCYPPARGQYGYHTWKSWKRKDLLQNLGYLLLSGMRHHTQSFGKMQQKPEKKKNSALQIPNISYDICKFSQQRPEDTWIPGHLDSPPAWYSPLEVLAPNTIPWFVVGLSTFAARPGGRLKMSGFHWT